jgi:hypothetical protein
MENEERELLSYPGNSKTGKRPPKPELEQITSGIVKQQKPSWTRRLMGTFIEDDTRSVGDYIVHDVLVPAAKAMLSDMVGGGIDMLLFGGRRGSRTNREGGRSYVNYNSASYRGGRTSVPDRDRDRDRGRDISRTGRARHDFGEIVLETRGEAEEVLSALVDLTIDYDQATVADLYDLVGITSNFTDNKYGWTDLRNSSVSRVRGGYLINLPKTQQLE